MPANYLAVVRYNVIDRCLRDRSRKWQWNDLAEMVAFELKEHHNMDKTPSKRTVMGDIYAMRSGALGYYAPIIHSKDTGYEYANRRFSIHQVNLPASLISDLEESFSLLRQLTRNEKLNKLSSSLTRISHYLHLDIDPIHQPVIHFEHSLNEPGQRWLDIVYDYTRRKAAMTIHYAPFSGHQHIHCISPAFIKEYNNRWYIFGYHYDMDKIVNLALDRIIEVHPSLKAWFLPPGFNHDTYFKNLFGVTVPEGKLPVKFKFETNHLLSQYMDTKPIHPSQIKISATQASAIYEIEVYDNYEIRSKLLSFGSALKMIYPTECSLSGPDQMIS